MCALGDTASFPAAGDIPATEKKGSEQCRVT